ncbi:E3 ubiquitin-protein ligase DTX3L-like isoform X4 [Mya arenaria]|uniref:E3 ubiquitin-protein ligase DTX3L-like isoform X2 n=1 Tax=Mya arenaria TaxID=6604 RepID=UPI0022E705B7|nr:E3 ubiquitin-protein ligase DTX3L-like isoform X2 [Mya arenaria]XP_052819257.1 E3 ubiquitin-protein ligase DTX3L-like isoform X4 [Mya arenaria]
MVDLQTRKELIEALIQAKQELDKAETTRTELCDEVKQVKHDLDNLEKEMEVAQTKILHIKGYYEWTQPAGTVSAKTSKDVVLLADIPTIKMSFTFQDGIQTHVHPSPGKPYKGGKFTGRLVFEGEALLVCRMMKAAFRRGRMFTVSKNGKVILDGVSLFNYKEWSSIFRAPLSHYTQKVKAELMAKGITEEDIDPTEELEETFIVDGLSMIEVVLNS